MDSKKFAYLIHIVLIIGVIIILISISLNMKKATYIYKERQNSVISSVDAEITEDF